MKIKYNETVSDYGKLIRNAIEFLKDGDVLEFERGEYVVSDEYLERCFYYVTNNTSCEKSIAFHLKNKKNIIIKGNGSKLLFTKEITPFVISNCENIDISGFEIDYTFNNHLELKIVEVLDNKIIVSPVEGFELELKDDKVYLPNINQPIFGGLTMAYDSELLRPSYRKSFYFLAINRSEKDFLGDTFRFQSVRFKEKTGGLYEMELPFTIPFVKDEVLVMCVCPERKAQTFFVSDSKNTSLSDIEIFYSPSMAIIAQFCENLTLNNVNVERNGKHGMLTSLADSVHCLHCTGKISLRNCKFFNMMDDALNVHGLYTKVISSNNGRLTVKLMEEQQSGINAYKTGDVLTVYKGYTLDERCKFTVNEAKLKTPYEIELTGKIDGENVAEGDIVSNKNRMPEVEVINCSCGNNRPRGFLLTSSKKMVVDGCRFSNCEHGIECAGDTVYWYEAGGVNDLTVKNCTFENCNYAAGNYAIVISPQFDKTGKEQFYHKNIKIENNLFLGFSSGMIYANAVDGLIIVGNDYRYVEPYEKIPAPKGMIFLEGCKNLYIENNYDEACFREECKPFWLCDKLTKETVVFLEGEEKTDLLYPAKEILKVTDYSENIQYADGVDYACDGGKIIKLSDTIPQFTKEEFYRLIPDRIGVEIDRSKVKFDTGGQRFFKFDEIEYRAVKVDYIKAGDRKYTVPQPCTKQTELFRQKLKSGEKVRICFYGDSITEGADASACRRLPPYIDKWSDLLVKFFKLYYKTDKLISVNSAMGGKCSDWGLKNFRENVLCNHPDLLILAFGMNDGMSTVQEFSKRIEEMICLLREQNDKAEIVLVATSVPNPQSTWYLNQSKFGTPLKALAERYGCAFCDMGTLTEEVFKVKNYRDCTSNNVNHLNDFGTRLYLHSLLNVMLGDEYIKVYKTK